MKISSLPTSTAVVIIDMQPAYFKTPRLKRMQGTIVRHTNELIHLAHTKEWPVINVRTVHARDKSTWTRNMLEDNQGFAFADEPESGIVPNLDLDVVQPIRFTKTRDDAFHGTDLLKMLKERSIEHIVLTGVAASSCIFHTAASAYANDLDVTLYTPAICDEDESAGKRMIDYLVEEYRQQAVEEL